MTLIEVLSCKGNIVDYIHRKRFKDTEGYDMKVPYKGKWYKVRDMRHTNLDGYAIYPWGTKCGKRRK